jgi:UDP-N-acetylglucosamine acyltransferase
VQIAGHVTVGDWAILGGTSAIHQFVSIGAHAFLGGGSLVRKDVPPFVKAAREPLSYAGVNSVGLRRRGFSEDQVTNLHNLYRLLFLGGMNTHDAMARIEAEIVPSVERDQVVEFVRAATRGIIKGPKRERSPEDADGE